MIDSNTTHDAPAPSPNRRRHVCVRTQLSTVRPFALLPPFGLRKMGEALGARSDVASTVPFSGGDCQVGVPSPVYHHGFGIYLGNKSREDKGYSKISDFLNKKLTYFTNFLIYLPICFCLSMASVT